MKQKNKRQNSRPHKSPSPDPLPNEQRGAKTPPGQPVSIVGVGASAGGLEAFEQLLAALSPDSGMAFVLVQHLAPRHESILAQLLARATTMPVVEVTQGKKVEPN